MLRWSEMGTVSRNFDSQSIVFCSGETLQTSLLMVPLEDAISSQTTKSLPQEFMLKRAVICARPIVFMYVWPKIWWKSESAQRPLCERTRQLRVEDELPLPEAPISTGMAPGFWRFCTAKACHEMSHL